MSLENFVGFRDFTPIRPLDRRFRRMHRRGWYIRICMTLRYRPINYAATYEII
ncbi:hypothetical protein BDR04DRAFT_1092018 [Suillus decipiens]|nr:hypothetical protein BDR04DRAFT_1092018 [Suillus decipiens]